jgi:hypothetical protein
MSAADVPVVIAEMKRRDGDKIARGVWQSIDSLGPVHVPPPFAKSQGLREAIKQWNHGGTIDENNVEEFTQWLAHTTARSKAVAENERRLNTTIWAHERLRWQSDYDERFAQFFLDAWGVEEWRDDPQERADQVKACARKGMPSVKPQRRNVNT